MNINSIVYIFIIYVLIFFCNSLEKYSNCIKSMALCTEPAHSIDIVEFLFGYMDIGLFGCKEICVFQDMLRLRSLHFYNNIHFL